MVLQQRDCYSPSVVAIARAVPQYGLLERPLPAPELPDGVVRTVAEAAIRDLFAIWGLDRERFGTPDWNPLGVFIRPGSKVLLKPNWVIHYNRSNAGLDCLVTHPSVIEAVLRYVGLTRPGSVVLGDAPVQGCDFDALRRHCRLDEMKQRVEAAGLPIEICDFRRTVLPAGQHLGAIRRENLQPLDDYVLFDLAGGSLLEAVSADARKFRVTMYNPDLLMRTHAPGRHQYLIARHVIDAGVVINLAKLKSHKKSGITGALKNMVGINGNKEYLPHHRRGGEFSGGDCYPGGSPFKLQAENLLDAANRRAGTRTAAWLMRSAEILASVAKAFGDNPELEGAWYGNDTIWRTSLDLQRILYYGGPHGTLLPSPQRTVVTITDAIVGGEGEGPLANTPIPSGFVTGSLSTAAAEWCHALLMGFDPQKIPIVREAFRPFTHPLVTFEPADIRVRTSSGLAAPDRLGPFDGRAFLPPSGWRGHCEMAQINGPIPEQPLVA